MALRPPRLPPLPALRDFINIYQLKAKKQLSQNYLMDMNLSRKLVKSAGHLEGATVLEVGPGPGGITRAILERNCRRLDVVEIDDRFLPALELLAEASVGRMSVHNEDVMKFDVGKLWEEAGVPKSEWIESAPNLHIIGNLPFNISTPLIIRYLRAMADRTGPWSFGRVPLTLTFQKEVGERIVAPIAHPQRSRLSIMSQFVAEPKLLFIIPGNCFVPAPEVDVAVVKFLPRDEPLIRAPFELVEKVCRHLFHYRRKFSFKAALTLYPTDLAEELTHEMYRRCRISPQTLCTRLGMEEVRDMCYLYEEQCRRIPGLFLFDYRKPKSLDELAAATGALPRHYRFSMKQLPPDGVTLKQFDKEAI